MVATQAQSGDRTAMRLCPIARVAIEPEAWTLRAKTIHVRVAGDLGENGRAGDLGHTAIPADHGCRVWQTRRNIAPIDHCRHRRRRQSRPQSFYRLAHRAERGTTNVHLVDHIDPPPGQDPDAKTFDRGGRGIAARSRCQPLGVADMRTERVERRTGSGRESANHDRTGQGAPTDLVDADAPKFSAHARTI